MSLVTNGIIVGFTLSNLDKLESLKTYCSSHAIVATGNASVTPSGNICDMNSSETIAVLPPNNCDKRNELIGAQAMSSASPIPGNKKEISPNKSMQTQNRSFTQASVEISTLFLLFLMILFLVLSLDLNTFLDIEDVIKANRRPADTVPAAVPTTLNFIVFSNECTNASIPD